MSCFWDGLRGIAQVRKILGDRTAQGLRDVVVAIGSSGAAEELLASVSVNGTRLTLRNVGEATEHLMSLRTHNVNDGYLCSTCDPVLCIISAACSIVIRHRFLSTEIVYSPDTSHNGTVSVANDRGHFWRA